MPILSRFRHVTDTFTHRHKHKINVDDNPLCSPKTTESLHQVGLRHSYCINKIDEYLKRIKDTHKSQIKLKAETRGDIPVMEKRLKEIINKRREHDSKALSEFINQAAKNNTLTQQNLDARIAQQDNDSVAAVQKILDDPMSELEYTGGAAPSRTKILGFITAAKQQYLKAVDTKKSELEQFLFKKKGNSYEVSSAALRKTEQEVDELKQGVITLCSKFEELVSVYQASISNEAIKRQDKQAKLQLGKTAFAGLGDAFGRITFFGDAPAAISDSIGSIFDVLIAYQSMKEPVAAQQAGAKFLVEVVFDQTKEFVRNVEKHFSAFQRSLAMWNEQLKQSYQISHDKQKDGRDEELLQLKKEKYGKIDPKDKVKEVQPTKDNPLGLTAKQLKILQHNKLEGVFIAKDGKCLFNATGHQIKQSGDKVQKAVLKALANFDRAKSDPALVKYLSETRLIMKLSNSEEFIAKIYPAIQNYNWTKDIYDFVPKLIAIVAKLNLTIIKPDGGAESYKEGSKTAVVLHTGNHYHSTKRIA